MPKSERTKQIQPAISLVRNNRLHLFLLRLNTKVFVQFLDGCTIIIA